MDFADQEASQAAANQASLSHCVKRVGLWSFDAGVPGCRASPEALHPVVMSQQSVDGVAVCPCCCGRYLADCGGDVMESHVFWICCS